MSPRNLVPMLFRCIFPMIALCVVSNSFAKEKLDWSWSVDSSQMYESVIKVSRKGKPLVSYTLECNLADAVQEQESEEDPELPTIDQVEPLSHPDGLLVVSCIVGAHSRLIQVFDPMSGSEEPLYKKTGSYFATSEMKEGVLVISYDQPCSEESGKTCEVSFEQVEVALPIK